MKIWQVWPHNVSTTKKKGGENASNKYASGKLISIF